MKNIVQRRIELSQEVMEEFFRSIFKGGVSALSAEKGLPYGLIYNIVHGRIHSLSAADYRRIFGQEAPEERSGRVDGSHFRKMVRLWLFLNEKDTKKNLYKELYPGKRSLKKIDYRIFTGGTKTVEGRIEGIMEHKFREQGLTDYEITNWTQELEQVLDERRIPYEKVKPLLDYLRDTLDVHPTRLLNQSQNRYESGKLKTVAESAYERLKELHERTEKAANSGSPHALERLKEEVYGEREEMTLFFEVEEELQFLKDRAGRGPKRYLGRGTAAYRRSDLKRIASWRARRIRDDCEEIINGGLDLKIKRIPSFFRARMIKVLLGILKYSVLSRMIGEEGLELEKKVLTPSHRVLHAFQDEVEGLVTFESIFLRWGMSKRALDLLVANHSNVFKMIGRYVDGWRVPKSYLNEVLEKQDFHLVREKYEWLARGGRNLVLMEKTAEPVQRHSRASDRLLYGPQKETSVKGGREKIKDGVRESGEAHMSFSDFRSLIESLTGRYQRLTTLGRFELLEDFRTKKMGPTGI